MIEGLIAIHREVMATVPATTRRYLYDQINWAAKAICIYGDRGVGKSTMIAQRLLDVYKTPDKALYISADNIIVSSMGLFTIAQEYFSYGGEALFIDEVHKYKNWSVELKNIIDTYKNHHVIFTGSSSLDLQKSKGDLSRRVVYYRLGGLSFREFLQLNNQIKLPVFSFEDIIKFHVKIVCELSVKSILKYFRMYLYHGYYPFYLEGIENYLSKLNNVIEKVIYEDISIIYNLKVPTTLVLKKILWLVASAKILTPNIDSIAKNLQVSREIIYNCLKYLDRAGLIHNLYPLSSGMKLVRKPGKIVLNNSNMLYAINGTLNLNTDIGAIRETFFTNQIAANYKLNTYDNGDYIVMDKYVIEVGGKNKSAKQIQGETHAYLALDDIEVGFGNKVPLYLFGFLN
jgi:uncharacterized protein